MKTVFTPQEIENLQRLVNFRTITQSQFVARLNEMAHEAYVEEPLPHCDHKHIADITRYNVCQDCGKTILNMKTNP